MDRNYKLLKYLFTSIAFATLVNCFGNDAEENPLDLPKYNPSLEEAVGRYYFVPLKDEFRDDYKYLNLKKGDTLFLEVKNDSTCIFNYFYHHRAEKINNLTGKFNIRYNETAIIPNIKTKNQELYLMWFVYSKKNGLYFINDIQRPNDTDYEYSIIYKKMK